MCKQNLRKSSLHVTTVSRPDIQGRGFRCFSCSRFCRMGERTSLLKSRPSGTFCNHLSCKHQPPGLTPTPLSPRPQLCTHINKSAGSAALSLALRLRLGSCLHSDSEPAALPPEVEARRSGSGSVFPPAEIPPESESHTSRRRALSSVHLKPRRGTQQPNSPKEAAHPLAPESN